MRVLLPLNVAPGSPEMDAEVGQITSRGWKLDPAIDCDPGYDWLFWFGRRYGPIGSYWDCAQRHPLGATRIEVPEGALDMARMALSGSDVEAILIRDVPLAPKVILEETRKNAAQRALQATKASRVESILRITRKLDEFSVKSVPLALPAPQRSAAPPMTLVAPGVAALWVGGFRARVIRRGQSQDLAIPALAVPGTELDPMGQLSEADVSDNWISIALDDTYVDHRHLGIGLDGYAYVDVDDGASAGTVLTVEDGLVTITATPA